jgi:hypothetical protein
LSVAVIAKNIVFPERRHSSFVCQAILSSHAPNPRVFLLLNQSIVRPKG